MTVSSNLLIRCDASVVMGTGHAMRCLALAQAWQDAGGKVTFAMAEATPSIESRLRIEGAKVVRLPVTPGSTEDLTATCGLAREEPVEWVVVDGYHFHSTYQNGLRAAGLKILLIDDLGEVPAYSAHVVLNQNLHANEHLYRDREAYTRLLLGPRYILLRREFTFWRKRKLEVPRRARRILLTLGGSDPDNVTEKILKVLLAPPELELTVVMGGSNPHFARIEHLIQGADREIRLLKDVSNMPALMVWADLVVAGAGTTSWEMCMMGVPAALCVLAPNQEQIAAELVRIGVSASLGDVAQIPTDKTERVLSELLRSQATRAKMSVNGRRLVDGRGADRVVALLWGDPSLRRAIDSDCRNFWEWANEQTQQAASPAKGQVSWERHMQWFRTRLADPKSILYTAVNRQGVPIGMVRYQLDGTRALLSIAIGTAFRGKRNGRKMLFQAIEELFQNSNVTTIDALVKPSNQPSVQLFEGAGFRRAGTEAAQGERAIHYVLEKSAVP